MSSVSKEKTAQRIGNDLARLAEEARTQGLDVLAYLIDIAQFEAGDQAKRKGDA